MKKIIYKTTLALFLSIGLISCDSELDQSPHDNLGSDQAYITAQDFENAIRGTYSAFAQEGYYGGGDSGDLNTLPEVLGDNVIRNPNGRGTKRSLYDYNFNSSNANMSLYQSAYSMIYRANLILHYLDANNFTGESRTKIAAEARALRAIAHFDAVKFYAKIPSQGGTLGLGIPYENVPNPKSTPARPPLMETYTKIIEDLEFAYDNLGAGADGRLSKQAVALYLARVHLYLGGAANYQKASDYASSVTVQPAKRSELAGLYKDMNKAGLVFYISNLPGAAGINASIGVAWGQGNIIDSVASRTSEYNVTKSLYDLYTDEDIRKTATMKKGVDVGGNPGVFITKIFGKGTAFNGVVDFKILRAEEAILIKAEAEYRLGNIGPALAELDKLRSIRYENFVSGNETGIALWDAIKLERRLELAFEYSRFLDIKRWGENVNRVDEGHHLNGNGTKPNILNVQNSNIRFVLPYSQNALNRNLNTVQNPGY